MSEHSKHQSDRLTRDYLKRSLDDAHVSMSAHGKNALTGGPVDRLPPRLWNQLRIELQRRYRNATGEDQAILSVEREVTND